MEKAVVTLFTRSLSGDPLYMMAELYFADENALQTGVKSEDMRAAGENLDSLAEGLVTTLIGGEIGV